MSGWPTPGQRLLLRVALAPDREAESAWEQLGATLDLDSPEMVDFDLLPLLGHRLSEWGVQDPRLPRLVGMLRRTWYANQRTLSTLAERLRVVRPGPRAVLGGRVASALQFFPNPGLLLIDQVELHRRWHGATEAVAIHGVAARVPVAADHLLGMLLRGWWPDAAYTARSDGMDWERFVTACDRRRVRTPVRRALAVLADLSGRDLVPAGVSAHLARPSWRERLERRQFAGIHGDGVGQR